MNRRTSNPPALPTFQTPPTYIQPTPASTTVPKVLGPGQIMRQGSKAEALLPQWLQLNNDPLNPAGRAEYETNFFSQYINPQIEQAKADLAANGQNYGSYAGGLIGQLGAQGALSKFQAGLDYGQQLFNNQIQGRTSYFAGGPSIAANQNAANVQRGLGIAQLDYDANRAMNAYNLDRTGQINTTTQAGFKNAMDRFGLLNDIEANRMKGLGMLGLGTSQLLGQGIGSLWSKGFGSALGGIAGKIMPSFIGSKMPPLAPAFQRTQYGGGFESGIINDPGRPAPLLFEPRIA